MSSGKSSSSSVHMAAVLLLVAVVAGTCASGAQAEFDIINNCIKAVVITPGASDDTYRLKATGGSLSWPGVPSTFFVAPEATVTIKSIPSVVVTIKKISVDWLNQVGDRLHKIVINCEGNCIRLDVTYTPLQSPETSTTVTLGPFCP